MNWKIPTDKFWKNEFQRKYQTLSLFYFYVNFFSNAFQILRTRTRTGIIPVRGLLCSYKCFNSEGHDYFGIAYVGDTWCCVTRRFIGVWSLAPWREVASRGVIRQASPSTYRSDSKRKTEKEQAAVTQKLFHVFFLGWPLIQVSRLQTAYRVRLFKIRIDKKEERKRHWGTRRSSFSQLSILIRRCFFVWSILLMFHGARS